MTVTSVLSRLFRTRPRLENLRVTVYTRHDCGCCRKALEVLGEYQRRYGFVVEEVDIDADPELRARYDTMVPVVAINGKVRFKGVVNRVLLERLLVAEERNRGAAGRSS